MRQGLLLALALLVMSGCEGPGFAPIRDNVPPPSKSQAKPSPRTAPAAVPEQQTPGRHIVQAGDTLFSIAFVNGLDYRDVAVWNNLESPDIIKVGQVLRLTPPQETAASGKGVVTTPLRDTSLSKPKPLEADGPPLLTEPRAQRLPYSEANWKSVSGAEVIAKTAPEASKPAPLPSAPKVPEETRSVAAVAETPVEVDGWRWPAEGKLLGTFGQGGGKGIDISGARNAAVVAAAPGKVVYSGSGLRGYGKMLIVKHEEEFLTAYAHNETLLAKEGQWVKGGQKIAEMGDTDSDRVKLHFEVRQYGKPLDPLKFLPERK